MTDATDRQRRRRLIVTLLQEDHYGFSNMACFSLGGLGPTYAGFTASDEWTYGGLAIVAMSAGMATLLLCRRRTSPQNDL